MISAGQLANPQNPAPAAAQTPATGPAVGTYSPVGGGAPQATGMPQLSGSVELNNGDELFERQQNFGMVGMILNSAQSMLSDGLNYALANKSLEVQQAVAERYYQSQDTIAGFQRDVAIRQLVVQEKAIDAQQGMHREQMLHEQKMARIEGSVQARLVSIQEDGKTQRAEVMTTNDVFARNKYMNGMPLLPS